MLVRERRNLKIFFNLSKEAIKRESGIFGQLRETK
jgi:hypothetical protein